MRMLNRNPKRLSAEVFSSAQKQLKQNASSQNREENGSTTLRKTREKPLLAGYGQSDHWIAVVGVFFLHAAFPFSIGLSAISCSIFLKTQALAARPCILLVSRPVVRAKSGKKRAKDLGAASLSW